MTSAPRTAGPRPSPQSRERLRALLGLDLSEGDGEILEALPAVPPEGDRLEVTVRGAGGERVPAFLLRPAPSAATGAAAVLVAGHGRGIDALVATSPADEYHDALAHKLVEAGMVVLCPEMVSFGRRRAPRSGAAGPTAREPGGDAGPTGREADRGAGSEAREPAGTMDPADLDPAESTCAIDAARHLLHGTPVMGHRVADARAAVQALRRLPGIDPDRIAVVGGSGGGAVSLLLAAADETIPAALVATYFCSFEASIASIRHCPCNIVPGLLPELEMADIAALVAPRPLILEAGERDHIFPISATRASFAQLDGVWEALGASPPELVVTDAGHAFRAGRSLEALCEVLG